MGLWRMPCLIIRRLPHGFAPRVSDEVDSDGSPRANRASHRTAATVARM